MECFKLFWKNSVTKVRAIELFQIQNEAWGESFW